MAVERTGEVDFHSLILLGRVLSEGRGGEGLEWMERGTIVMCVMLVGEGQ